MTTTPTNPIQPFENIERLSKQIARLCLHARILLITRAIFLTLGLLLILLLAASSIDFLLRLPMGIRFLVLAGIIYAMIRCWSKLIIPAWKIGLTKSAIALRIEHQTPSLKGMLTASIDLIDASKDTAKPKAHSPNASTDSHIESALSSATIAIAARRLGSLKAPSILAWNQIAYAFGLFLITITILALLWTQTPNLVSIGAQRTLSPWTSVHWPKRFPVEDTTQLTIHPIDIAIPIRATIAPGGNSNPFNALASIRWRILDEHNNPINTWQSHPMIAQQQGLANQDDSVLFERLIEPPTLTDNPDTRSDQLTLQYSITTRDDQTPTHTITLVRPPELLSMSVDIQLPPYAQSISHRDAPISGTHEFTSADESLSPILKDSSLTLTWRFSKPVHYDQAAIPNWITSLIDDQALSTESTLQHPQPDTLVLHSSAQRTTIIEPGVVDLSEIAVRDPIRLHLGVIDDLDPEANIIAPATDENVSPEATLTIVGEFLDDLGLNSASLSAKITTSTPDQITPWTTIANEPLDASMRTTITHDLSITTLNAKPGDTIHIIAKANDLRSSTASTTLGTSESRVHILHVVSKDEITDQIRANLTPITRVLRRLDQDQTTIQAQLQKQPHLDSTTQHQLSDQLDRLTESFEQMSRTLVRNAIDDQSLSSLIAQATTTSTQASKSSTRAGEQIEQGSQARALETQSDVRDQLGELLTLLDRGQDSWLAIRSVEKLRDDLIALREQTDAHAAKSGGQSLDQLSDQQRTALEQIVKKQLEAANDAREALATLDDRAQSLEENDPAQAQALKEAANRGRQSEIEKKLNQSADQISNNQTASASSMQTEVIDELEEMLEELEHAINDRDNQLRRVLASIMESIEQLIIQQKTQINIAETLKPQDTTQTINAMIRLVGNTLSVRDDATGAYPETLTIADKLVLASRSQQLAIESFRQAPPQIPQAIASERSSLHHLEQALLLAEQLDDEAADRQAQEKRTQLRDAYRESLESQIIIRDQTRLLGHNQLSRRQRRDARALATTQEEIGTDLADLFDQSTDLAEAPMFALAHSQLESQITKSITGLAQRSISTRTLLAEQSTINILTMLVEALDDAQDQSPQDFDDGSEAGSGNGSGSGNEPVIPPIAQLKLLRAMQQLAATQTTLYADEPISVSDEELQSLSDLQTQLFEHGRLLIEQLSDNPTEENTP